MFCIYCGGNNPSDARFCHICGRQMDKTTVALTPDIMPVPPLPGIPMHGIESAPGNVPLVQGTPQISNVPSVPGAPPSAANPIQPGGFPAANTSNPGLAAHAAPSSQIDQPHAAHSLKEADLHAGHPPHLPKHHAPTHPHPGYHPPTHPHPGHHPHMDPHTHPEYDPQARPLRETPSRPNSLQSGAASQALSGGVKVAGHISRRALLIALGGAAAVATVGASIVYVNNAISTPQKTISNYLEALKRRDGKAAYEQLSSRFQRQVNEQQYISAANFAGGFIGSYTISNVQENDSTATAMVSVTALILTANYTVQLMKENGVWKIDGGTLINIR